MMTKGEKGINEILDMPLTFMLQELSKDNKKKKTNVKKSKSMLEAFGGSDPEANKK